MTVQFIEAGVYTTFLTQSCVKAQERKYLFFPLCVFSFAFSSALLSLPTVATPTPYQLSSCSVALCWFDQQLESWCRQLPCHL